MALLKGNTIIYGVATVQGNLKVGSAYSNTAVSNTTGSLIVTGGVGITGNLYTGNIVLSAANSITFGDGTVQTTAGGGGTSVNNIIALDDISGFFDGITTAFSLSSDNVTVIPYSPEQLLISIGGTIVSPFINSIDNVFMPIVGGTVFNKGYVLNDDGTIQFAYPPQPNMDFDGRLLSTTQNQKTTRTYPFAALSIAYDNY